MNTKDTLKDAPALNNLDRDLIFGFGDSDLFSKHGDFKVILKLSL